MHYAKLFEPGCIGPLHLKNRLVMPPMETNFARETGAVSRQLIKYHEERAKGGVGLIIVEFTCVDYPEGKAAAPQLSIHDDKLIAGHNELVEAVHRHGAKIALQLVHAGRQTDARRTEGKQPVAPSPIPCGLMKEQPRELSISEIEELVEKFALAAQRAKMAGYDAVELHGAHGYLIAQFMSGYTNKRLDRYGGSLERRLRFPLEVIQRIKQKVGSNYPLLYRFSADEFVSEGIHLEEAKAIAKRLEGAGVAALHVSTSIHETKETNVEPMAFEQGWRVPLAAAVKQEVNIPVITVGVIREPEFANQILAEGKADFVAIGRGLIADPEWAIKARDGRTSEIRKCTSCCNCISRFEQNLGLRCQANAQVGREEIFQVRAAEKRKKVMVAGGGPGGMEAARIAALRGHDVTLYERSGRLGGQLNLALRPTNKQKLAWLMDYLIGQMSLLPIKIKLNALADVAEVKEEKPDVMVIATGSQPLLPEIEGMNDRKVVTAWDVLEGNIQPQGEKIVVLGGQATGCEVAELLGRKNEVTILCRSPRNRIASNMDTANRKQLLKLLEKSNIKIIAERDVLAVNGEGLLTIDRDWNQHLVLADRVVLARGQRSVENLSQAISGIVPQVYLVGDCVSPRKITEAIYEGFWAGLNA